MSVHAKVTSLARPRCCLTPSRRAGTQGSVAPLETSQAPTATCWGDVTRAVAPTGTLDERDLPLCHPSSCQLATPLLRHAGPALHALSSGRHPQGDTAAPFARKAAWAGPLLWVRTTKDYCPARRATPVEERPRCATFVSCWSCSRRRPARL
eukprot:366197-Chlamydomonas_euryale.AAC.4